MRFVWCNLGVLVMAKEELHFIPALPGTTIIANGFKANVIAWRFLTVFDETSPRGVQTWVDPMTCASWGDSPACVIAPGGEITHPDGSKDSE
jgi:hypothetical protein